MPDQTPLSGAGSMVVVTCIKCPLRMGRYARDRAIAKHGDITLEAFARVVSAECYYRKHSINFGPCQAHAIGVSLDMD